MFGGFCEADINELLRLHDLFYRKKSPDVIDLDAVVANYEGHSVFSIFNDEEKFADQVLEQIREAELPNEVQDDETEIQHHFIRRIFRVLTMPTPQLLFEDERQAMNEEKA